LENPTVRFGRRLDNPVVKNMKISIVIPAYNEAKYLKRTIDHVLMYKDQSLPEIIVVDNNSTDNTFEIARSFPMVKVFKEPKKGVAFARQKGFLESKGDIVAFLDADTSISENWFRQITKEFENNPRLVCLSGPWGCFDVGVFYKISIFLYWLFLAMPSYFFIGYMAVGGNMAIRRHALESVGGFDETIAFYGDDTDIARRLNKIGKVKFSLNFRVSASGRRFKGQGMINTGFLYVVNFLSEVFLHRPATKTYRDIR
jgi:glycosyltransferase involved in cell wall biosynthesis